MIPATKSFTYYRGDTYSFIVTPLDSDGAAVDLTSFTPSFTIADVRGSSPAFVLAATCSKNGDTIVCTIDSDDGDTLTGSLYVYDVQVTDGGSPAEVHTYLTGTITVSDDVEEP